MSSLTATRGRIGSERVHYFARQLITADDMLAEQEYFRQKMRRHNRLLHGWGVVCGCEVMPNPSDAAPWQVRVCPGYALTPQGDEILISEAVDFDLARDWWKANDPCPHPAPCPPSSGLPSEADRPKSVYLAICYAECKARPVRVSPVGCGCDETGCDYSRVRDSFDLVRLSELPESHQQAAEADKKWLVELEQWRKGQLTIPPPPPIADCPDCPDDVCVVLATIALPKRKDMEIEAASITYDARRILYRDVSLVLAP